jgi:hypothetical protein
VTLEAVVLGSGYLRPGKAPTLWHVTSVRPEATVQTLSCHAIEHLDELVQTVVPALVAAELEYSYDEEGLGDLRRAARESLMGLLMVLAGDASGQDPLETARATGRRQVQQALPLEGVLRAYRLAGQILWEHFVASARASSTPLGDALIDGASEIWRTVDVFSSAAAEAYRAEEGRLRQRDERVQAAVLGALLEGKGAEPQFARDASHALGVPLGGPFVCVLGIVDAPDGPAFDDAQERLRRAGTASAWTTFSGFDVGLVALGRRSAAGLRDLLEPAVRARAGMSPAFTDLADLPRARHLAEVAARTPGDPAVVRMLDDDLVGGLVVDAPLVATMVWERTIGKLLAAEVPDGPALLGTLRAFLAADASLNTAAAQTFVHRNTMLYRLNKIEKLTGCSVRVLQDQVLWVLALKEHDARQP